EYELTLSAGSRLQETPNDSSTGSPPEHVEALLEPLAGPAHVLHRIGAELLVLERALEQHVGGEDRVAKLVSEQPYIHFIPRPHGHRPSLYRGRDSNPHVLS